jgi:hypothetical protein
MYVCSERSLDFYFSPAKKISILDVQFCISMSRAAVSVISKAGNPNKDGVNGGGLGLVDGWVVVPGKGEGGREQERKR